MRKSSLEKLLKAKCTVVYLLQNSQSLWMFLDAREQEHSNFIDKDTMQLWYIDVLDDGTAITW